LDPDVFALADVLQDVVQKFSMAAIEKGVRLHSEMPERLPLAYGDIGLLERVLDNLVENALQHTPAGGTVSVRLASTRQSVAVEVADTGSGIAPDDLPRIFDRFFRGEGSRPSASASAGLGLAIVKSILELHGTEIHVASTVGAGTTFRFEIPARAREREDVGALLRHLRGPIRLRQRC
jgi:signal transduction histidine kinase